MDIKRELPTNYNEGLGSAELLKPKANAEMKFLNYLVEFLSNMKNPDDVTIQKSGSQESH